MVVGWLATALAGDTQCEISSLRDVLAIPAPAVIVLGERHGTQPDLYRAAKVVHRLQADAHVTVALESVDGSKQTVLDDFANQRVSWEELPTALDWENSWGFRWQPYAPLVTASVRGAKVVAAGLPLGAPPEDATITVPTGYFRVLESAMSGHPVPPASERDFVRSMAWRDQRIAEQALAGWDGEGFLVIVTGRSHVEGGKGVTWQIDRRTDAPVHGFALAWGGDPPCFQGDRVWRADPFFG